MPPYKPIIVFADFVNSPCTIMAPDTISLLPSLAVLPGPRDDRFWEPDRGCGGIPAALARNLSGLSPAIHIQGNQRFLQRIRPPEDLGLEQQPTRVARRQYSDSLTSSPFDESAAKGSTISTRLYVRREVTSSRQQTALSTCQQAEDVRGPRYGTRKGKMNDELTQIIDTGL